MRTIAAAAYRKTVIPYNKANDKLWKAYRNKTSLKSRRALCSKAAAIQRTFLEALQGSGIGDNCFIMENNVIKPFATIGNDVTMWGGSIVGHESVIMDHCFVAAHVVISGAVTIEPNCFIGVNATIRDEITIARECVIGAGAVGHEGHESARSPCRAAGQLLAFSSNRLPRI